MVLLRDRMIIARFVGRIDIFGTREIYCTYAHKDNTQKIIK